MYWMSRDQRTEDNWALLCAQERAMQGGRGLMVVFCLQSEFLHATLRQYSFMLSGLEHTCRNCLDLGIPFVLRFGRPPDILAELAQAWDAESVICDFDPLRIKVRWRQELASRTRTPLYMVDAHNIVPCWEASDKQEYAARTIRPKIQRQLVDFLTPFPGLAPHPFPVQGMDLAEPDWKEAATRLTVDADPSPVSSPLPGAQEAKRMLGEFVRHFLAEYAQKSNDPNAGADSGLSAYLHFGQLAPQRAALEVQAGEGVSSQAKSAFLEQLIVRRELTDNFCWHNPGYDSLSGLPEWAQKTLEAHQTDPRPYVYSPAQLEAAATHDDLWNAAQLQMTAQGKMHGYMRMYWAKKVLEWTRSPQEAIETAVRLNDRYELDGRDPNGYVGVLWSIGGVHDHGFKERPVFGKIRYMSYAGCKRKFDVRAYVRTYGRSED
jgi:deoxyribodipyrimidine photo-lyase